MSAEFVEAFVSAIQIWNLEMDKEYSFSENIDQKAVNRFIYSELLNEWRLDRLFNNGRIKFQSREN